MFLVIVFYILWDSVDRNLMNLSGYSIFFVFLRFVWLNSWTLFSPLTLRITTNLHITFFSCISLDLDDPGGVLSPGINASPFYFCPVLCDLYVSSVYAFYVLFNVALRRIHGIQKLINIRLDTSSSNCWYCELWWWLDFILRQYSCSKKCYDIGQVGMICIVEI